MQGRLSPALVAGDLFFLQDAIPGAPDMLLAGKGIAGVCTHRCLPCVQAGSLCVPMPNVCTTPHLNPSGSWQSDISLGESFASTSS